MSVDFLSDRRLTAELAVLCSGLALRTAILTRGAAAGLLRRYNFFYTAIACSFLASSVGLWLFASTTTEYRTFYWNAEFVTAFAACGIVLDILRHAFAIAPTTERFARVLRYATYAAVVLFSVRYVGDHGAHASAARLVLLERNFRLVQTAILLILTAGVFYFGLPLGRNVKGMLIGYGLYIASNLATLTLKFRFPTSFDTAWTLLQPLLYCASLVVYLQCLWSYRPAPHLQDMAEIAKQADELLEVAPERLRLLK